MKNLSLIFFFLFLVPHFIFAQKTFLQSGPMVGYSEMKEVALWVQTKASVEVKIAYYVSGKPETKQFTETITTKKNELFIAKPIAYTEPGLRYDYELYINEQKIDFAYPLQFQSQALWQWRTDPPAFEFAIGSCNYINEEAYDRLGKPYGGEYQIFEAIRAKKPEFMLWMGDNTYLREVDWNTTSGVYHRYTHTRSVPEMQALLASTHNYAIWDDHDYGPNDSDRSYWLKDTTQKAFKLFWPSPNYVMENGVAHTFFWNDCQFFMLDNRYFRSPQNRSTSEKAYLGNAQLEWLIDALAASQANFKFVVVGGQVLNSNTSPYLETYQQYAEEKTKLLEEIEKNNISGVIFLDGDRHHTELSKMDREGNYPLYDLTISPLTAGAVGDRSKDEDNKYRVPETYFGERNFGMLRISGPRKERVLTIRVINNAGKEIWKKEIKATDLQKK
jgi:alkaline phosphatase D